MEITKKSKTLIFVVQMYREKLELTLKILEEYHEDKKN